MPGVLVVQSKSNIKELLSNLEQSTLEGIAIITLVDDSNFVSENIENWLWATFTRSNPAEDIFGLHEKVENKHWSCTVPVIDARIKKHHAPMLIMPDDVLEKAKQKLERATNEK